MGSSTPGPSRQRQTSTGRSRSVRALIERDPLSTMVDGRRCRHRRTKGSRLVRVVAFVLGFIISVMVLQVVDNLVNPSSHDGFSNSPAADVTGAPTSGVVAAGLAPVASVVATLRSPD